VMTHGQTDRQTQTDFIICPIAICYSYGADNYLLLVCFVLSDVRPVAGDNNLVPKIRECLISAIFNYLRLYNYCFFLIAIEILFDGCFLFV